MHLQTDRRFGIKPIHQWARFLGALSLGLPLLFSLAFAPSAASGQGYSFHHYGAETGLGNSSVLSLLQDHTGFIWVGTEAGLYRYEGLRFTIMGPKEGLACGAEVTGLYETLDGALWVVACNGLFRAENGHFEAVIPASKLLFSFEGITGDGHGHLLVATARGLQQISIVRDTTGHFPVQPYPLPMPLRQRPIRGLFLHGSTLWFACEQRLCAIDVGHVTAGHVTVYGVADGLPEAQWSSIRVFDNGEIWARSTELTYHRLPGQKRFTSVSPALPPSYYSGFIGTDSSGKVLIPTDGGLAVGSAAGFRLIGDADGLRTSMISVVMEDREGSLWIGLVGEGLARWVGRGEWESWTKSNGLPSKLVWSILRSRSDSSLWVGTSRGVLRMAPGGKQTVWDQRVGLGSNVRWLAEAPDGGVWAVMRPSTLARIDPRTGSVKVFNEVPGLPNERVSRGAFDHLGRLWVATSTGLFRADHPSANARFTPVDNFGAPTKAWDVIEDRDGVVWATSSEGLWRFREGSWRTYTRKDGLLADAPYIIALGPDGSLWLRHRHDGAVERIEFSGNCIRTATTIQPRQSSDPTAFHGFDHKGNFWQGTPNGAAMLEYTSINGHIPAAGPWRFFTVEDGLVANDCDGEAFWADSDGSVWIGTSGGLSHYSPRSRNLAEPATVGDPVITSIRASSWPPAARIEFSALNFKLENAMQFAYSLDGDSWVENKDRDVSIAGLGPGAHRFVVRTRVAGQPWSPRIASAEFRFDPFWWQTWWARTLALVLVLAILTIGVRAWNSRLRRKARERARMEEEKASVRAASQAKSLFLAHMSHEIRTPLQEIIGLTDILEGLPLPASASESVRLLRSSGKGLMGVLNGILDFSKIEAGKLDLELAPFALRDCLGESLGLFAKTAKDKSLALTLDIQDTVPKCLVGDGTRLRQILMSFISNALKFTHQGEVGVSASLERVEGDLHWLSFTVRDSGIGIPADRIDSLFHPFTQVDASINRRYGGTGLGLTIAKSLVELMGGSVAVHSTPGVGTVFSVLLPFVKAPDPVETPVTTENGASHGPLRILVAEDNAINQRIILKLIERLGYSADLARDGAEAVGAALGQPYDVIVMDVQMPRMDGLEAAREIRARALAGRQPYIVALTAHATTDDRRACLEAGMDDYFTKPIDIAALGRTLHRLSGSPAETEA